MQERSERMGSQSPRARRGKILRRLRQAYADAECALVHDDPFQLLISTILSAQTTDKAVNRVTPALFRRYADATKLAGADPLEIEPLICSIGLFRTKAKAIVGAARGIVERFSGRVPQSREELCSLPGVGRKTANVVLPNAFGIPGLAVDTHVKRVSRRLGLTEANDPVRIEKDLTALFRAADWGFISHALIWHGRLVCDARRPRCLECTLGDLCPSSGRVATQGVDSKNRRTSA